MNGIPLESLGLDHEHEDVLLGAMHDPGYVRMRTVSCAQTMTDVPGVAASPATIWRMP